MAPLSSPADKATFGTVVAAASHAPGVVTTVGPQFFPAGPGHPAVALAEVYPTGSPQAQSTTNLITDLRNNVVPGALHGSHLQVLVGGQTALGIDLANQLSSKLPLFVGMVVALSSILLMVVFRSLAIPATAAIMNLLSAAAAFGVITDYQVFLVSRIQEEWLKRRDNSAAVRIGQATTGRIISAAAAIMTVVFFAFTFTTDRTIKMIGLGMAAAVVTDSLVVRTVLVPAVMHTLGRTNWRIPRALDRVLPRLDLEDGTEPASGTGHDAAQGTPELDPAAKL